MEIAINSYSKPFETYSAQISKPLFNLQEQYLSKFDACQLLEQKLAERVSVVKSSTDKPHPLAKKAQFITLMAVAYFSLYAAFLVCMHTIDTAPLVIDRSQNQPTLFYCPALKDWCSNCITPDGYWIDQNTTQIGLELPTAILTKALATTFFPPLIFQVLSVLGIYAKKRYIKHRTSRIEEEIAAVGHMKATLERDSNNKAPLEDNFIFWAIDLNLALTYSQMSFSQLKAVKIHSPKLFEVAFEEFSEKQRLYWCKLKMMTSAPYPELIEALQNRANQQIFREEPAVLETLIQSLQKLTPSVETALAVCMQGISAHFAELSLAECIQLIDLISTRKCSFAKALFEMELAQDTSSISLHFGSDCLKVPAALLCHSSPIFNAQYGKEAKFMPTASHRIAQCNRKTFKAALRYFETGQLSEQEDMLFPLCKLADFYQMNALTLALEAYLSQHLSHLLTVYGWNHLLELSRSVMSVRKILDIKFASELANAPASPLFDQATFLERLEKAATYEFEVSQRFLLELFHAELCAKFKALVPLTIAMAALLPKKIDILFAYFVSIFESDPTLLGDLWKEAKAAHCKSLQREVISFCNHPGNVHILLANWPLPPNQLTRAPNKSNQSKTRLLEFYTQ